MTETTIQDQLELKALVDEFSVLCDMRDPKGQGNLFLEDGELSYQIGGGTLQTIKGREALTEAFQATIEPCKTLYHINGQQVLSFSADGDTAQGTCYCIAVLMTEQDGQTRRTTNYLCYADHYRKVNGSWFIASRHTYFVLSAEQNN